MSSLDHVKRAILQFMRSNEFQAQKINDIGKALHIPSTGDEHLSLREALQELENTGELRRIERRRYVLGSMPSRIIGKLDVTRGGSGYVIPEEGESEDIVVRPPDMHTAMHGDRVAVKLFASRRDERPVGEVVEVLERRTNSLVGTLNRRGSFYVVMPDDRKFFRDVYVATKSLNHSKVGDKVVVTVFPWEDPLTNPEGEVTAVLGRAGEPRVEIAAAAAHHKLSTTFSREVVADAEAVPAKISEEDIHTRLDLRNELCFTIDPDDARDFDDAVSMKNLPDGNVEIGVHIADVSHFVKEGTALDKEAFTRGTSVYLVNGVVPMLPERLSNELCSLRPNEDRLTYSIIMNVSPRGTVKSYQIRKSIIRSKRRFTYDEALSRIETGTGDFAAEIQAMRKAADILSKKRHREGGIDFETTEVKFKFDEKGYPTEVIPKRRSQATNLIEEFMLLANQTAARHVNELAKVKGSGIHPFLYRIHDVPRAERIAEVATFVKRFGFSLDTNNIQPQAIQKLLESVKGSPEEILINGITLRAMAKAVYSEHNIGHFGLSSKWYTHFTSPIRRYPDLIVHRLLFEYDQNMSNARRQYFKEALGGMADWCSRREQTAVEAERDSVKIAKAEYISQHVGEEFDGQISGVQPYGIFVELKNVFVEGLIRVRDIEGDNYFYDEKNFALVGRSTKHVLRLGDTIRVLVKRVNRARHEVDLELVEMGRTRPRKISKPDNAPKPFAKRRRR